MLTAPAPSRAGSLPHLFCAGLSSRDYPSISCGSRACSRGGLTAGLALSVVRRSNCGSEPARDGGLIAGKELVDWVHIRCCGNGGVWFRPYGGALSKRAKVTKALRTERSRVGKGGGSPGRER